MVNKKILIIEDNRHLLTYIENALRKEGFEVLVARTGLEAIELLAETTVDVVFMDYFLPNLNADRLCQIIRRMEHLKTTHLVIMSAAASELDLDKEAIGADAVIAKGSFKETARLLISLIQDAENPAVSGQNERMMGFDTVHPRQMTKELLAQNRHLQAVLDSLSEGILEIHKGRVVYANPAAEILLGIPMPRLLASYLPDLLDVTPRSALDFLFRAESGEQALSRKIQTLRLKEKVLSS